MRQTLTEDDKKERMNDGRESKNKETNKEGKDKTRERSMTNKKGLKCE